MLDRLPRGGGLFDVGANMGLRALYALSQGRPVTMFEPNVDLRAFTESLLEHNRFENCVLENVCVGAAEGTVPFFVSSSSYLSSLYPEHAAQDGTVRTVEVPMTTIDTYVAAAGRRGRFAAMKIDVEGAELEVVKGAEKSIGRMRPALLIESQPHTRVDLDIALDRLDFVGLVILERRRRPLISFDRSVLPQLPTANFLYLPREEQKLAADLTECLG